jgi:hypothetical protein
VWPVCVESTNVQYLEGSQPGQADTQGQEACRQSRRCAGAGYDHGMKRLVLEVCTVGARHADYMHRPAQTCTSEGTQSMTHSEQMRQVSHGL